MRRGWNSYIAKVRAVLIVIDQERRMKVAKRNQNVVVGPEMVARIDVEIWVYMI